MGRTQVEQSYRFAGVLPFSIAPASNALRRGYRLGNSLFLYTVPLVDQQCGQF